MSNEVISNCKFCGATGVIVETPNKQFYPRCTGNYDTPPSRMGYCLLTRRPDPETDGYNTRELALAAWNRKPEPEPITAEALQVEGWERQEGRNDTSYFYLPNVSHTGLKVYFKGNSIEGVYVGGVHFFGVTGMNGLKDATILVYGDF